MEVLKLFEKYAPIMSIYETADEYICFPERKYAEPLAVFYDKNLKQYKEVFFYEDRNNSIVDAVENGVHIYGEELDFSDDEDFPNC